MFLRKFHVKLLIFMVIQPDNNNRKGQRIKKKDRLEWSGMNIMSVARDGAVQNLAHESAYAYGVERKYLPPKPPEPNPYVVLPGYGHMETTYQYRYNEGWLGDVPVSFTSLMAYRSYEYTKQVFYDFDRRHAVTNTNSWIV
jgi:hypothetical protein